MFGKNTKAHKEQMKELERNRERIPKNYCQICKAKLIRVKARSVKTSRIKDYYRTYDSWYHYEKQIPIYENDYIPAHWECPIHGEAGVHPAVRRSFL